ncbi:MAG TPA: hypothetical protein DCS66_07655 [Flavobacteriaceae bacterium]|nr:hypothetical protein [Flavobacteriaceae bacterium]
MKMEKKLQRARFALMTMFEVLEKDILFMNSRKQNNVHSRMFYNYYLWKNYKIPHNQIKNYIEGMHHATSIYLKNKLEHEMKQYDSVSMQWITFLYFTNYKVWKQKRTMKEEFSEFIKDIKTK